MNRVEIIGYVNGSNPEDMRCLAHVDFVNHGPALFTGAEFSCTYCGDQYRDGLTETERYERKHNVRHCDSCLSFQPVFTGDKCGECVIELEIKEDSDRADMVAHVMAQGINVDIIEPGKAL